MDRLNREIFFQEFTKCHEELGEYLAWAKTEKTQGLGYLKCVAITSWVLLSGPMNALSTKSLIQNHFGDSIDGDKDLVNSINALHRLFFNGIMSHIESALIEHCESNSIKIICNYDEKIDSILKRHT